jgi:putative transcriptional regulator
MNVSHEGMLLLATPRLVDPNFLRTVVLVIQHGGDGAVGVVLNRETPEPAIEHLPDWGPLAAKPGLIHFGGPVEPDVAVALSTAHDGESTGVPGLNVVDLANPPTGSGLIRVYSGYAGWGEGQLEAELAEGSWYLVQAAPDDPFDAADGQWTRILRRQPGRLAIVSTFPTDANMN